MRWKFWKRDAVPKQVPPVYRCRVHGDITGHQVYFSVGGFIGDPLCTICMRAFFDEHFPATKELR